MSKVGNVANRSILHEQFAEGGAEEVSIPTPCMDNNQIELHALRNAPIKMANTSLDASWRNIRGTWSGHTRMLVFIQLAYWRNGILAYWRTGILVYWCTGVLAYWRTGVLAYWRTGILAYWRSGVMAYWHTGVLAYWRTGVMA
jgi:hypothetical protein